MAGRQTAMAALGLGLALWLGGCAFIHDFPRGSRPAGHDGAWLGYFSGADIHAQCGETGPDVFRLVWRRGGGGFRVLEVIGNEAGGALMLHYAFEARELAEGEPPREPPAPRQRLPLSPDDFAGLVYWFDRLGLFSPVPGAPGQPGAGLEWLISGCLGGNWMINIHLPSAADTASGVPVSATPALRPPTPWPQATPAAPAA